jgi:hypothetical protein
MSPHLPDPLRALIAAAVRAPSIRNTQPWRVVCPGPGRVLLYTDGARHLPGCDPSGRQVFLAHGAFLELFDMAAREGGFRTDLDLFPDGWPGSSLLTESPVARIDIVPDPQAERDPLHDLIPLRHTNGRPFRRRDVPLPLAGDLTACCDYERVALGFTCDPGLKQDIGRLIIAATELELSSPTRLHEALSFFRFTDREAAQSGDGFGLAQEGYGRLSRFFIGSLLFTRRRAEGPASPFPRFAAGRARRQAETAGGFGWLSTKADHRIEQVRAGRALARVHLKATGLGLAFQSMPQVIADYPEAGTIRNELYECLGIPDTLTVQALFRLGYAAPVPPPARRGLEAFLAGP